VLPSVHNGQRAPGLRFGEPRTMALLGSVAAFAHVIGGLTNRSLRTQMGVLWQAAYTSAQASDDLRRLRLKGLIERIEGTNTYRVTGHGLRIAAFFTQLAARVVIPALTELAALARPPPAGTSSPCRCLARLRTRTQPAPTNHPPRRPMRNFPQVFRTGSSSAG
jgi:hypothetical protein